MHAYMNEVALQRTCDTGELHLWSRSRGEQWHKGATSGNTQASARCAWTATATRCWRSSSRPAPPATPASAPASTAATLEPAAPLQTLPALERTIAAARAERPAGSYTVELLDDPPRIGEKVMEEAEEVARAAREESDERVDEEAADVLYHLLVLLRSRGRSLADAERGARWPSRAERRRGRRRAVARRGARARRRSTTWSRCATSFIDDCETPVSAFLKLRGRTRRAGVPARVGRAGPARRALVVHRRAPALGAALVARRRRATPTRWPPRRSRASARRRCPTRRRSPAAPSAIFGYDLVRTVEPLGEPNPDVLGLPDMALMLTDVLVVFDHLKHTITILANAYREDGAELEAAYADAARGDRRGARGARRARAAADAGRPAPRAVPTFESNMPREQFEGMVARIVEYIHAGDAFQVVPVAALVGARRRRRVLRVPRAARRQPEPVHVLPRLRRLPDRGRSPEPLLTVAGRPRQHAADRRDAAARRDAEEDA